MDHSRHYSVLISRATARTPDAKKYYELHHIVPECVGGTNHKDNLVYLTAAEHYIAHRLLPRIYTSSTLLAHAERKMQEYAEGAYVSCRSANKKYAFRRSLNWVKQSKRKGVAPWNKGLDAAAAAAYRRKVQAGWSKA